MKGVTIANEKKKKKRAPSKWQFWEKISKIKKCTESNRKLIFHETREDERK